MTGMLTIWLARQLIYVNVTHLCDWGLCGTPLWSEYNQCLRVNHIQLFIIFPIVVFEETIVICLFLPDSAFVSHHSFYLITFNPFYLPMYFLCNPFQRPSVNSFLPIITFYRFMSSLRSLILKASFTMKLCHLLFFYF